MAGKKRGGSSKKKSSSSNAVAAVASSTTEQATDELFMPKSSSSATTATKTETKKKKKIALDSDDASDSDDDNAVVELKVNEKFAKAFQEQKRKEELNRLERQRKLYGDADDESDSESESETEDEDGEQLTSALDADIRKTLQLIRKKDPAIYDQSITFFKKDDDESDDDSSSSDDGSGARKPKRKAKAKTKDAPLYYKDLVRQQVIAGDVDSEDDADKPTSVLTYGEEQAKLKQDFLATLRDASASDDDSDTKKTKRSGDDDSDSDDDALDGGLFTIRKKTAEETQAEADEYASFTTSKQGRALAKAEVDPDAFLAHYLSSEGWKDKRAAIPHYDDIVNNDNDDDDDSADELERAEAFEHSYNFRFEEDGSGLIQTHARRIDDTLRREDDSRKRKRAERKERKALERRKKEEELRRLKNLKQAEIESKLAKVAKLMGKDTPEAAALKLTAQDLDGAFDPDEYDRRMQEVFDDAYYNEADGDDADALVKPVWDEDEDKELFAGLPVDSDDEAEDAEEAEEDGDTSARVNIVEAADEDDEENNEADEEEDDDDVLTEAKAKHMSAEELARAKQKYLDELYALDYEDLIGDLKCRFKYRSVATNDFGLTVDEIMAADDKELKALVSLKRLAPYADEEYRVDRKRVKQFKKTLAEAQRERDAKRLAKAEAKAAAEDGDAVMTEATETAAPAGGKKRKRAKKSKAAAAEPSASDSVAKTERAEPTTESKDTKTTSVSDSKKKQRRSKKKSDGSAAASSALKATGLSSSRLESYKLTKASKPKDKKAKK